MVESQKGLGWKEPSRSSNSNPLPWQGQLAKNSEPWGHNISIYSFEVRCSQQVLLAISHLNSTITFNSKPGECFLEEYIFKLTAVSTWGMHTTAEHDEIIWVVYIF